jgi:hypothetical protein
MVNLCGPDATASGCLLCGGLCKQRLTSAFNVGRQAQMIATLISIDDQTAAPTLPHVTSVERETL